VLDYWQEKAVFAQEGFRPLALAGNHQKRVEASKSAH